MREITPAELLSQLRGMVEMLAAPANKQLGWLIAEGVPVDELALQLNDAVPSWFSPSPFDPEDMTGRRPGHEKPRRSGPLKWAV